MQTQTMSPTTTTHSRTPRASCTIAMSLDGRYLAVASGESVWLEDARDKSSRAIARAGVDLAIACDRVWIARGDGVEGHALAGGERHTLAVPPGHYALAGAGAALAVWSAAGAWIVRGDDVISIGTASLVRAIGDARFLVVAGDKATIIDATSRELACVRVGIAARILDATAILDRSTCLLLVARGTDRELVVMRGANGVLARIRVGDVCRIYGAARRYTVAVATSDGRAVVYDLRERAVLSADRLATGTPVEIVLDRDGERLAGIASTRVFERRFPSS